eukprot:5844105-Lingulodinium_polyedra.AAC.1
MHVQVHCIADGSTSIVMTNMAEGGLMLMLMDGWMDGWMAGGGGFFFFQVPQHSNSSQITGCIGQDTKFSHDALVRAGAIHDHIDVLPCVVQRFLE